MNNATRKQIQAIIDRLESAKSVLTDTDYEGMTDTEALNVVVDIESEIDNVQSEINDLQSEEQDKFDNLSEGLQASERGEAIEAAADALSSASDECDTVLHELRLPNEYLKEIETGKRVDGPVNIEELTASIADAIDDVIYNLEEAAQ
jgi:hypothetical protein